MSLYFLKLFFGFELFLESFIELEFQNVVFIAPKTLFGIGIPKGEFLLFLNSFFGFDFLNLDL